MNIKWKRLYDLRKNAKLTRDELAGRAGITETQIYRLESGYSPRNGVKLGTVEALAAALGVRTEDLVLKDDEDPVLVLDERLRRLPDRDLAYLAKEAGKLMRDAESSHSYRVFYSTLPAGAVDLEADAEEDPDYETELWYNAACIIAYAIQQERRHDLTKKVTLPEAVGEIGADSDADYIRKRLENALDTRWNTDGYAAELVQKLVRLALQEGYRIDTIALLRGILGWNDSDQSTHFRWAKEYREAYETAEKRRNAMKAKAKSTK